MHSLFQNYDLFAKVEGTNAYSFSSYVFFVNEEDASIRSFLDFRLCLLESKVSDVVYHSPTSGMAVVFSGYWKSSDKYVSLY